MSFADARRSMHRIAEYADAARQIGVDAIHFENPRQLQ
jgi:hypothetical protein